MFGMLQIILCFLIATARWARHMGKHMSYAGVLNDTAEKLDKMESMLKVRILQVVVTGMVVMLLLFLGMAVISSFRF